MIHTVRLSWRCNLFRGLLGTALFSGVINILVQIRGFIGEPIVRLSADLIQDDRTGFGF